MIFDPGKTTMRRLEIAALTLLAAASATAKQRISEVHVESTPPGALVAVAEAGGAMSGVFSTVAGETPITRSFRFPKKHGLMLRFEKRGFEPMVVEIDREATRLVVDLVPVGSESPEPAPIRVLAVVRPELEVVRRGFSKEREDEAGAERAADAFLTALKRSLGSEVEVVAVGGDEARRPTRILWRDVRSQLDLIDPIRLPFASVAPRLENRSPREALATLSELTGADAVLFISGTATVETGGMKAGKIGIMAAGTACSYASGYSNAMASGSDFFTYDIYLPEFAEGLFLEALVVDVATATVRWANKGMWNAAAIKEPAHADSVVADLMTGLRESCTSTKKSISEEEEP